MSSHIAGAGYSIVITVAPMLLVIVTLIIMQRLLGYTQESYYEKQLFQNTVLYIFIFSLLASAPLNAVLSRYISDVIFEETYADIMPCYYLGLLIQTLFCCLMGGSLAEYARHTFLYPFAVLSHCPLFFIR